MSWFKKILGKESKEKLDEGLVHVRLLYQGILMEILDELGEMPLPPYIHQKLAEKN